MEAVIFVGVQGSGKTTFYRDRFFETHVRINLDMLKTRHREQLLLAACLAAKQPFVVDNTNPLPSDRARYIGVAREAGFRKLQIPRPEEGLDDVFRVTIALEGGFVVAKATESL